MVFPYVGLALFVIHGVAATVSKRAFASEYGTTKRRIALVAQVAALLVAVYVMRAKPF